MEGLRIPLHQCDRRTALRAECEAFYALCGRAKAPATRFHDTRHSCGTLLHVRGAGPNATKRYVHPNDADILEAMVEVRGRHRIGHNPEKANSEERREASAIN
jgi:hypothetical protein